jgi:hypothetical protein
MAPKAPPPVPVGWYSAIVVGDDEFRARILTSRSGLAKRLHKIHFHQCSGLDDSFAQMILKDHSDVTVIVHTTIDYMSYFEQLREVRLVVYSD